MDSSSFVISSPSPAPPGHHTNRTEEVVPEGETVLGPTHRFERGIVRQLTDAPSAHPAKACRHARHVGTCPACQRANAKRMAEQLTAATLARQAWLASRAVVQQSLRAA
jgi:hypothetical protein